MAKGRWPVHVDPDDITRVCFRDPVTRTWYALEWEHTPSLTMPLSEDALRFARRLAAAKYTYPDDRLAVTDLLERWNLGLGNILAERRMALRLSREQAAIELPAEDTPVRTVSRLPSVARVLARTTTDDAVDDVADTGGAGECDPEAGDDDADDLDRYGRYGREH